MSVGNPGSLFPGMENTHFGTEGDFWWFGGSWFWGTWAKVICSLGMRGRFVGCSWLQIMKVLKFHCYL